MEGRDIAAALGMLFGLGALLAAPYTPLLPWWVGVALMAAAIAGWLVYPWLVQDDYDVVLGCEYTDQRRWEINVTNRSKRTLHNVQLGGADIEGLRLWFDPINILPPDGKPVRFDYHIAAQQVRSSDDITEILNTAWSLGENPPYGFEIKLEALTVVWKTKLAYRARKLKKQTETWAFDYRRFVNIESSLAPRRIT